MNRNHRAILETYINTEHTDRNTQTDIIPHTNNLFGHEKQTQNVHINKMMKANPLCQIRNFLAGLLGCNVGSLKVTPTPPDLKNAVTVNGEKPGSPTSLNVGSTIIVVEVTSEDGSNKQVR